MARSPFAKTKTVKQQRAFLPVYGSREDLMHVIRENNVVVVVGETGVHEDHADDPVHARGGLQHAA